MKPGITGPWQIHGNGLINDFEEIVKLDCKYIDDWSLWLDCKILLRTIPKVLRATGW
jgi:lipopolysaccharide/colanic/teichoic acid biosynthesis glycosyltransferase